MNLPEIDTALFFVLNRDLQSGLLDAVMTFVTRNPRFLLLPLFLWGLYRERERPWQFAAIMLLAVALADGAGNILKGIFGRERPCHTLADINLLVGCGKSFSMPSNHAANAFAFASVVLMRAGGASGALSLAAAGLIGYSRIYVGVHYPFDVVAGGLVGALSAFGALHLVQKASRVLETRDLRQALFLSLLVISLFRIYFIMTAPFDLTPDEAHYWEWSRRLDLSYYSKGPVIAYLIAAGTTLFGDTVLGVRVFAVLLSALSSLILFRLASDLYDEKTGLAAALLLQAVPLYSVYGVILTIDSPFIFFWSLSLLLFHRILRGEGAPEARGRPMWSWAFLGAVIGIGMLAKYTMAFFFVSGLLFLLSRKDLRRLLATPGPYVSALSGFIAFSPVMIWNSRHGWVTMRHTAGQAHVSDGMVLSPIDVAEFVGSQLGVVTPILLMMIGIALWRLRRDEEGGFLLWFSLPTVFFFLLKSFQGKVQANWALTGYITGLIAFSACYMRDFGSLRRGTRILTASAVLLALAVTLLAHFPSILNLPEKKDPTIRLVGWRELGREASRAYGEVTEDGPAFVFSDSYGLASQLAFYMEGNPVTYCVNLGRRMNQYDLWPGFDDFFGRNALFVRTKEKDLPAEIRDAFASCDREVVEVTTKQKKAVKFTFFKCYDFRGMVQRPIERY